MPAFITLKGIDPDYTAAEPLGGTDPLNLDPGDAAPETTLARGKAVIEPETLQAYATDPSEAFDFIIEWDSPTLDMGGASETALIDDILAIDPAPEPTAEEADAAAWGDSLSVETTPEGLVPHGWHYDHILC